MSNFKMTVLSLQLLTLLVAASALGQQKTFVEACLGDTKILDSRLTCQTFSEDNKSSMMFILTAGEKMQVQTRGVFGKESKSFNVVQITHLPPRLTDEGVMDESVQFKSQGAVMTIPCHQTAMVTMGTTKEVWAACKIQ